MISPTLSREFVLGEYEGGLDDVADFAGAGGDPLQGLPATGEQGEAAFAEAASSSK